MTTTLPVTVAATRRARPAHEDDLHRWATTLSATAATFHGHVDSKIWLRRDRGAFLVTVALTFASAAAASAWESSPARTDLLALGDELTDGATVAAPLGVGGPQQARWRTALVVWAGLLPFALLLNIAAESPLAAIPVLPRTVLTTAVLVPLAVYLGIPAVQRLIGSRPRRASRR